MTQRHDLSTSFLTAAGWHEAIRAPLAGDASNRRYERLKAADGTPAVLMDAPPEKGEDVRPFVHIAEYLTSIGLSAPRILAADAEHGFLLLEDLGDDLFARVVVNLPALEPEIYTAATDVLLALHKHTPPVGLAPYSPAVMADMAALAHRWYGAQNTGSMADQSAKFHAAFQALLAQHIPEQTVLIQRDYHAENLLWLPERKGPARVGLLDFQDAMLGHPAYDLVSLLQDARRDVPLDIEQHMLAHYISRSGHDETEFSTAYALLGAQRNLRILGVFARLSLYSNKPHYVDFIPRVWAYLLRDLSHPALSDIRAMLLADLPAPSEALLTELKAKCGTVLALS
ncbi:aminoglycoside phosphotransferase family protein [Lentibacter sp. XHP0401]|uniref:aminoglycoside phosphotransferase family protein n=1 Tax=Lentibacter sp. XHP0401 TaxID=2984334 RepID=UPI0021E8CAC5|nr:phosphotransferase [Lentibacter sp. XHP0401]MCV2892641.1 phosphotransferase [Lentibacter sp. XHP0401]